MNITEKIEGYANLSPEEKLAKLEALTIEEPKDNGDLVAKYKEAIDKASAEASSWKKKYNDKLTEQEKAELERKEKEQSILDELKALKQEKEISVLEANYMGLGYSKQLANDTARAYFNGDLQKVFANQKAFLDEKEAKIKETLLMGTPTPQNAKANIKSPEDKTLEEIRKYAGLI